MLSHEAVLAHRHDQVLWHALTVLQAEAEVVLRRSKALLGGAAVEANGLALVLRHTLPVFVSPAASYCARASPLFILRLRSSERPTSFSACSHRRALRWHGITVLL